ncbi:MAG: ATP-binding protein [Phycisphaerae bacterium]|nr:AAA family ATPase [Phycisphaerae bacterium]NUQ45253.1 ATP-binding protein [Phycisphaerae bacterium]
MTRAQDFCAAHEFATMLIEFFGKNFGSFRDEFRLSMLATDIEPGGDRGIVEVQVEGDDKPLRLLRCAAIYGPNASGKSTVIRAASALHSLLANSARYSSDESLEAYDPFLLDDTHSKQPVCLGVRAVISARVYEYFVEFNQARILREVLREHTSLGPSTLFERVQNDASGAWERDSQFTLIMKAFRHNALLLGLADVFSPELAGGIAVGIRRLLTFRDPGQYLASEQLLDHVARLTRERPTFENWLLDWLKSADLGIQELQVEEEIKHRIVRQFEREPGERPKLVKRIEPRVKYSLALLHTTGARPRKIGFDKESMGTRRLLELAPMIHDLLFGEHTRAFFIDEIGASLHPALLVALLRYFNCHLEATQVRGQLVFATHETFMLDDEARRATLRRDQVYLTDKDAAGASRLYSLAEFKERQVHNLRRRYLQGRYGAIPSIGPLGG